MQSETLILMACSATKKPTERPIPLYELYDGPLWQTLREHKGDNQFGNVFVLSGKHGFCSAGAWSLPYEEKISAEKVDALIARGLHGQERHKTKGHVIGSGILQTLPLNRLPQVRRVIVAGAGHYRRFFLWLIEELRASGELRADVQVIVCDGAGIGYQRQALREALQAIPVQPAPVKKPFTPAPDAVERLNRMLDKLAGAARRRVPSAQLAFAF